MKTIVVDGGVKDGLRFVCETDQEQWRARTLLSKEPGTIAWLRANLKPGDTFYDIGANVGCYTLYAARLVGPHGRVYAFEPHPANVLSLLRNIEANSFGDRTAVFTAPLHSMADSLYFRYASLKAGSSGHQYAGAPGTVITHSTTLDVLAMDIGMIRLPTIIKIDVDGNEPAILRGARRLLVCEETPDCVGGPRSLQVELNSPEPVTVLAKYGYHLTSRHYTSNGQQQIAQGADPLAIPHNAIFEKVAVPA